MISRYEIVARIGTGGMGEVYRARDPGLGRDVAIKILPARFRDEPGRLSRFEQEVRAVGALDHPNILAVHDVGLHLDCPYLVSELLEGSSLEERMAAGDLTARRSLEIAVAIADGLAAAHERGIVHRDIKPGNVFITADGHVKILDFGVAKLASGSRPEVEVGSVDTAVTATQSGALVGTPAYMSPEQVRGEPVDHRTDIFSFGVVLYEMLARRRPFRGKNLVQLAAAIQGSDPEPLSGLDERLPPAVEGVVRRCLEKRPDERFSSAHDVALILRSILEGTSQSPPTLVLPRRRKLAPRWFLGAAAVMAALVAGAFAVHLIFVPPAMPDTLHLTVMPFEAGSPSHGPFALGVAESVERALALLEEQAGGGLQLLPQATAESWGRSTLEERGRFFNVTVGLRGRVELGSDRIRLSLDLVEPGTGRGLRTVVLDHDLLDIAALQHEPLAALADALGLAVDEATRTRLEARSTNVVAAYEPYLHGLGLLRFADDPHDRARAASLLADSTERDPFFAPAAAARADAARLQFLAAGDKAALNEARRWAARAVELLPEDTLGYEAMAGVAKAAGDAAGEIEALERATELAPDCAELHRRLGRCRALSGDSDEALAAYERALFLEPDSWLTLYLLGQLEIARGELYAAAGRFRNAMAAAPSNPIGANGLGGILYFLGRRDQARAAFQQSLEIEPNLFALSNLGTLEFEEGRFGTAAQYFRKALELDENDLQTWAYLAASLDYGGKPEQAEPAYRRVVELGTEALAKNPDDPVTLASVAGTFGKLGDLPRGVELAERAARQPVDDPVLMGSIAESFEELGERDRAVEWITAALEGGLDPAWVERRPSLQDLRADPRYTAAAASRSEPVPGLGEE